MPLLTVDTYKYWNVCDNCGIRSLIANVDIYYVKKCSSKLIILIYLLWMSHTQFHFKFFLKKDLFFALQNSPHQIPTISFQNFGWLKNNKLSKSMEFCSLLVWNAFSTGSYRFISSFI